MVKWAVSLSGKKQREAEKMFYFEGVHLLEEYLRWGKTPYCLFVREDALNKYQQLIASANCDVYEVTPSVYDKITEEKAPQGIFTVSGFLDNIKPLNAETVKQIKGNTVALADLQDNGNVGTVIRTAAALDCGVLLCGSCADIYSAKTVRATMGALFSGDIYISDSAEAAIGVLQQAGIRVIAAALTDKAEVLGEFEIPPTACFMVGNEGKGLKPSVVELCDKTAIIPMCGKTESLNAATAAAMLLWEAKRGKLK